VVSCGFCRVVGSQVEKLFPALQQQPAFFFASGSVNPDESQSDLLFGNDPNVRPTKVPSSSRPLLLISRVFVMSTSVGSVLFLDRIRVIPWLS